MGLSGVVDGQNKRTEICEHGILIIPGALSPTSKTYVLMGANRGGNVRLPMLYFKTF